MTEQKYFGEVVNSSLSQWTTQAWHWNNYPEFGAIVQMTNEAEQIFGTVYFIKTGSDDPTRQTFAYQKNEQELILEQPQIFEFIKTNFSCVPLAYTNGEKMIYALPPRPPKIHTFVRLATKAELEKLCGQVGVVQSLFSQYAKIEYFEDPR